MTRLRLLFFFTHWVKGTLSPTHYINGGFLLLLIPIQEVGLFKPPSIGPVLATSN